MTRLRRAFLMSQLSDIAVIQCYYVILTSLAMIDSNEAFDDAPDSKTSCK